MRSCPECGNQYDDDANFCPRDATRLLPLATDRSGIHQSVVAGRFALHGPKVYGSTGVTVEATDLQSSSRVTLKLVGAGILPTGPIAERALRELKQLSKISCARIPHVIDQGRAEDGRVYVATEVLEGSTLEELVRSEGPLSLERARAVILQIGEALTEAQKVGVIHRDVAPVNVLVGANDQVKLLNFGLAEPVNEKVFGSPAYLSPEQAEGKPVDQRSNIYSLGATYFFALTGEAPFAGDTESLLQQHLNAQPPAPSSRRATLPPEIDRIVAKALEKSGGRRHLTLRQLLAEVDTTSGVVERPAGAPLTSAPRPVDMAATMLGLPSPFFAQPELVKSASSPAVVTAPPLAHGPVEATVERDNVRQARPGMAQAVSKSPLASHQDRANSGGVPPNPIANASSTGAAAKRGGFHETAWFKTGEIEEELAKAQAKAASADPLAPSGITGRHASYDLDKVDVSAHDRARLSLKTGATQRIAALQPGAAPVLPGPHMDEREMLAELYSPKKKLIISAIVVAALIGLLIALVFGGR
jgi:serine/threonine protein kinase